MDESSKRRKWRRWLSALVTETERLHDERRLYQQVSSRIGYNTDWADWLQNLYLMGVSLAIRRLADANPRHRSISLVKLLQEIEGHPECLSRRFALRVNPSARRADVQRLFDQLAGDRAAYLPSTIIRQWREDFEREAQPFRAWVDHRVAHHDLTHAVIRPSLEQVEQMLHRLGDIVEVLRLLLGA